jgi:hypothetical protein
MVAHSRVKIADAPSQYPLTTDVFTLVDEIEEGLDNISSLQDEMQVSAGIKTTLDIQEKIGQSFQRVDALILECRERQKIQSDSGADLRRTSSSFTSSLDALQARLDHTKKQRYGLLGGQSTATELSDSQIKVNSDFLQVIVFFSIFIVVALLCAGSVATKDNRSYEMGLIVLVLVLLAYYIITKFLSPQPFF